MTEMIKCTPNKYINWIVRLCILARERAETWFWCSLTSVHKCTDEMYQIPNMKMLFTHFVNNICNPGKGDQRFICTFKNTSLVIRWHSICPLCITKTIHPNPKESLNFVFRWVLKIEVEKNPRSVGHLYTSFWSWV